MKTVLMIAVILASCAASFGQGQVIEKAEFDLIQNNSVYPQVRWKGKSFRSTITTESRMNSNVDADFATKWVQEQSADGTRSVNETRFRKDEPKRSELITIGDKRFVRTGSGPWTVKAPSREDPAPPPPMQTSNELSSSAEYRYLGTEQFRGQIVKTYLSTATTKRVNPQGKEVTTVNKTKYWYDSDGTMLKSDFQGNSKWDDKTSYTSVVMEYELDPSIKITAPDIP